MHIVYAVSLSILFLTVVNAWGQRGPPHRPSRGRHGHRPRPKPTTSSSRTTAADDSDDSDNAGDQSGNLSCWYQVQGMGQSQDGYKKVCDAGVTRCATVSVSNCGMATCATRTTKDCDTDYCNTAAECNGHIGHGFDPTCACDYCEGDLCNQ